MAFNVEEYSSTADLQHENIHPCFYFERLSGSVSAVAGGGADMVDAARSEKNAPRWEFTEDAEETGAAGKFHVIHTFPVSRRVISAQNPPNSSPHEHILNTDTGRSHITLTGRDRSLAAGLFALVCLKVQLCNRLLAAAVTGEDANVGPPTPRLSRPVVHTVVDGSWSARRGLVLFDRTECPGSVASTARPCWVCRNLGASGGG